MEVVVSDADANRESDGRPEGVATTDPIPELEHVGLIDAEGRHSSSVGGKSDEVLGDSGLVLGRLQEPLLCGLGVGDSLLSGERLGSHNEQSRLGVADPEGLSHIRAVNVGDEVHGDVALAVELESFGYHDGAKVRATNANVDDGIDGLSSVSLPLAGTNLLGELLHVVEHFMNTIVCALLLERVSTLAGRWVPEGNVKHCAVLGRVDVLAGVHLVAVLFDIGFAGEGEEGLQNLIIDEILGVVEEDVDIRVVRLELQRVLGKALRVGSEEVLEHELRTLGLVELVELLPRRVFLRSARNHLSYVAYSLVASLPVAMFALFGRQN